MYPEYTPNNMGPFGNAVALIILILSVIIVLSIGIVLGIMLIFDIEDFPLIGIVPIFVPLLLIAGGIVMLIKARRHSN